MLYQINNTIPQILISSLYCLYNESRNKNAKLQGRIRTDLFKSDPVFIRGPNQSKDPAGYE